MAQKRVPKTKKRGNRAEEPALAVAPAAAVPGQQAARSAAQPADPEEKGHRTAVRVALIGGAAVVVAALVALVPSFTGESQASQSTAGNASPIINATGGATVNLNQSGEQLSQAELEAIEDRFRAVGPIQTFEVRAEADYEAINGWLEQFFVTKNRKHLTPILFIMSVKEAGGDSAWYGKKTPMEIRDILTGYRREKRLGLSVELAPDSVIPMRGGDVLHLTAALPGAAPADPAAR